MGRPQDPVDPDAPEEARALAERLRDAMDDAGYNGVKELAEAAGKAAGTVSDALNGKRASWETVKAVLGACDVRVSSEWSARCEAAAQARRQRGQRARSVRDDPAAEQRGPGLYSIRPPIGELPTRVRGRDGLLRSLRETLAAPGEHVEVLHGLGGCGKTTVALSLARDARERGYTVFWVPADDHDRMVTALREIALELGADEEEAADAWAGRASATDLLWRHLDAAQRPWLLVLDNADDPTRLAAPDRVPGDGTGWVRTSGTGLTVVTTRVGSAEVWGGATRRHPVDVLPADDGADILIDLAGNAGTEAQARLLAERLGGLPLALRLAGAYLARTASGVGLLRRGGGPSKRIRTFDAYLEVLGDLGPELLDRGAGGGAAADTEHLHRRLISRTWELSLDLLDEQGLVEARPLMRLLSCFAPEPFPADLLDVDIAARRGLLSDPPALERVDTALTSLVDLSLVEVVDVADSAGTPEDEEPVPCLRVHRVVQESNARHVRESSKRERAAVWGTAVDMLAAGAACEPESPGNWTWWRLISPHVIAVVSRVEDDSTEILRSAVRSGIEAFTFLVFTHQYETVLALSAVLHTRCEALDAEDEVRLTVRNRHALAAMEDDEQKAEYADLLATQRRVLGEEHPETLMTRHNLAATNSLDGDPAEVESELRAVLWARRRVLGPDSPYTAFTQGVLAQFMQFRGDKDGAHAQYDALIDDYRGERSVLDHHSRHQIAHRLDEMGRFPEAEVEYRRILSELEEAGAGATGMYRDLVRCLAVNLRKQKVPEARAESLHYVSLTERAEPFDDQTYYAALHMHGDALWALGAHTDAEGVYLGVLEKRRSGGHDEQDSALLQDRKCLAHIWEETGRGRRATEEMTAVYEAYRDVLGPDAERTRSSLACVCHMLRTCGDWEGAERWYRALHESELRVFGEDHAEPLMSRFRLVWARYENGALERDGALEEMERAVSALLEVGGARQEWTDSARERIEKIRAGNG
ncbi:MULTISPECIES: tetratricopeptide repeat protein [Nocardiopsis]|uniref:HTH cro/C1-type domain-containing protein n=1 Tax=Nocardiopsis sinuspersici TaxID=501010 RepID=A0A1V3C276_9ACTN|nr:MULTISPECIES: tetratricopeptide repeat protein [Nocardiopsis]OOC54825.1 hypothetical protein NOSIN_14235 [Nocardiopsis sinuspersici]